MCTYMHVLSVFTKSYAVLYLFESFCFDCIKCCTTQTISDLTASSVDKLNSQSYCIDFATVDLFIQNLIFSTVCILQLGNADWYSCKCRTNAVKFQIRQQGHFFLNYQKIYMYWGHG